MLVNRKQFSPLWLIFFSSLCHLSHCIDDNNLLQNDLVKNFDVNELDLQHGLDKHQENNLQNHKTRLFKKEEDADALMSKNKDEFFQFAESETLPKVEEVKMEKEEKVDEMESKTKEDKSKVAAEKPRKPVKVSPTSDIPKSLPPLCLCDPPCESSNTTNSAKSKNKMKGDGENDMTCTHGRFVTRKDCPCCSVCAKQEGEPCGSSNDICDAEFGLKCSEETKICIAKVSCTSDSSCPPHQHCMWGACADPCPLLRPCSLPTSLEKDPLSGGSTPASPTGGVCVVRNHKPYCECPVGTILQDGACIGLDDSNSVKEKKKNKPGMVQLKILSVDHNSSLIALPSMESGELFYKSLSAKGGRGRMFAPSGNNGTLLIGSLVPTNSYSLNWLGKDGLMAEGEFTTLDGCVHGSFSFPVGGSFTIGCHSKCVCEAGGKADCMPRCLGSQVKELAMPPHDFGCLAVPDETDPECCVNFQCAGQKGMVESDEPKLIVMRTTHDAVTLAWDDFRSDNQDAVYTAQYREKTDGFIHLEWGKKTVEKLLAPPTVTIGGLKPDTMYEVRVSILDGSEGTSIGEHTETVTVTTKLGCNYMNSSYSVGVFNRGCEEACTCYSDGVVNCTERCTIPYFKKGSFKDDDLCSEQPAVADECCVLVVCQTTSGSQDYDPCVNIVCGPNAQCDNERLSINSTVTGPETIPSSPAVEGRDPLPLPQLTHDVSAMGHCKCLEGFEGNPTNLESGCAQVIVKKECHHQNQTYKPGEEFYNKCQSRCFCSEKGEIDCQPRCPPLPPLVDGCKVMQDPSDSCCQIHSCINDTEKEQPVVPEGSVDGCIYGNSSYMKNQTFTDGCAFKCICLGFGDVSCSPRCAPLKRSESGKMCQTLPDPMDECCTVTMCDIGDMKQDNSSVSAERIITFPKVLNIDNNSTMVDEETTIAPEHNHTDNQFNDLTHAEIHEQNIPHDHDEHGNPILETMGKPTNKTHSHDKDGAIEPTLFNGLTHAEIHEQNIPHEHDDHGNPILNGTVNMNSNSDHTHGGEDHSHDHTHGGEDHSHDHTHGGEDHSHDHTHGAEDHSHDHTHDDTHATEDHSHDAVNLTHGTEDHTHAIEDHSHDAVNLTHGTEDHTHATEDHSHDAVNLTHGTEDHTHAIEDHSHDAVNLTHGNEDHSHDHTHDSVNHTHDHSHDTEDHTHDEDHSHDHTHESVNHTHDHSHGTEDHSHDHTHGNEDHSHDHTHDSVNQNHTHDHSHDTEDHTHGNEDHSHDHTHDSVNHTHDHSHGTEDHSHDHTHGNEDHSHDHTHGNEDHSHDHTHGNEDHSHDHTHGRSNSDFVDPSSAGFMVADSSIVSTPPSNHDLRITQTTGLNETTLEVHVEVTESVIDKLLSSADYPLNLSTQLVSKNGESETWKTRSIPVRDITISDMTTLSFLLTDLIPGANYRVKASFEDASSPIVTSYLQKPRHSIEKSSTTKSVEEIIGRTSSNTISNSNESPQLAAFSCTHNDKTYSAGDTFYDNCDNYCMCDDNNQVQCYPIDCPDQMGLDLAEPTCLEWDIDREFVPSPPSCCPKLVCMRYSDCHYMGHHFTNYEEIPRDLTGCSQKCMCEYGNVTCSDACIGSADPNSPPPADLPCDPSQAVLMTLPGENCCLEWQCENGHHPIGIPGVFPPLPHDPTFGGHAFVNDPHSTFLPGHLDPSGIEVPVVTSLDTDSVDLFFSIPNIYKGLTGQLFVRYSTDPILPVEQWDISDVVTKGSLLTTADWDHKVKPLKPATLYTMEVVLMISRTNSEVTSSLFQATTLKAPPPSSIDARLSVSDIKTSSAVITWRHLTDNERMHIDGVQVKYKDANKQLMEFSPMLHHSTRQFTLEDLQPNTTYTVDLTFLPINHQDTTIMNIQPQNFTTMRRPQDPYEFDLVVSVRNVTATTVQVSYDGVPQPEEKYVNVYQLQYLRENDRVHEQMYKSTKDTFRELSHNALTEDLMNVLVLDNLKPEQTYQMWLVAYLTDGGIVKSNVIDVTTQRKSYVLPEKSELEYPHSSSEPNYYSALVTVSILATLCCVAFILLLLFVVKRRQYAPTAHPVARNGNKNGSGGSGAAAAYENPSFKSFDIEMNGMKSTSGNNGTDAT